MGEYRRAADVLRPLLFGNVPIDLWPPHDEDGSDGEISRAFVEAREAVRRGDEQAAVSLWRSITRAEGIERRHALQAWSFLRERGIDPDGTTGSRVLGVVVEMPVAKGLDLLAAYRDGTARYLNHSGRVAVVDGVPDLASLIDALLDAGQALADRIGLWERPDLPELPAGHARLTMLTPAGFRFGQGPAAALQGSPMAQGVLAAATALVARIVETVEQSPSGDTSAP